jgi:hypothetical protein
MLPNEAGGSGEQKAYSVLRQFGGRGIGGFGGRELGERQLFSCSRFLASTTCLGLAPQRGCHGLAHIPRTRQSNLGEHSAIAFMPILRIGMDDASEWISTCNMVGVKDAGLEWIYSPSNANPNHKVTGKMQCAKNIQPQSGSDWFEDHPLHISVISSSDHANLVIKHMVLVRFASG